MRIYLKLLLLACLSLLCFAAFGDTSPSPIPGAGAPPVNINGWYILLTPVLVAVLDFIFAISSKTKANGFIHWIYLLLGGKETPPPQL